VSTAAVWVFPGSCSTDAGTVRRQAARRGRFDHNLAGAGDLKLAEQPRGRRFDHPETGAPAISPALVAIIAAVDASISIFCWIAEPPTSAAKITIRPSVWKSRESPTGIGGYKSHSLHS